MKSLATVSSKPPNASGVTQTAAPASRNISLDILRVGAALAVVCVHVAGRVVMSYDPAQPFSWWGANLIGAAVHWCVPIFIMISGAVLLPHDEVRPGFYKRRLSKLGLPVIGATLGFLAYETKFSFNPQRLLDMVVLGKTHLWYLYMVVGLYAATPITRTFVAKAPRPQVLNAIILTFSTAVGYALITNLVQHRSGFSVFEWPLYLGYFISGYYMATAPQAQPNRRACVAGACACALGIALLNRLLAPSLGAADASTISYGYLNPLVIVMSLLLFRACYKEGSPQPRPNTRAVNICCKSCSLYAGRLHCASSWNHFMHQNSALNCWIPVTICGGLGAHSLGIWSLTCVGLRCISHPGSQTHLLRNLNPR